MKDQPLFWGSRKGAANFSEAGYDVLQKSDEPDTWMTRANEKIITAFANKVAKALGLAEPCIGFTLEELHDGNAAGVFIEGTETETPTIVIDVSAQPTMNDLSDTVAHELAHAFQWTQLSADEWDSDEAEDIAETFCRDIRTMGLTKAVKTLKKSCALVGDTVYAR